ncbi:MULTISPECIES: hypothetical protein [Bacillus cereus group]|uniref:Uncharacterized protein n=1 Tax=Bacillus proteolyticus TaxID=2026192 RepID=A0ABV3IBF0_9BACI|nr:hypothetical protein [Bacillus cereus group sp. N8]MBJ8107721.1 hypothetical protein [Bacillus cereus group sp. N8]
MTDAVDTDKGEFDAGKANGKFVHVTNHMYMVKDENVDYYFFVYFFFNTYGT